MFKQRVHDLNPSFFFTKHFFGITNINIAVLIDFLIEFNALKRTVFLTKSYYIALKIMKFIT